MNEGEAVSLNEALDDLYDRAQLEITNARGAAALSGVAESWRLELDEITRKFFY